MEEKENDREEEGDMEVKEDWEEEEEDMYCRIRRRQSRRRTQMMRRT